MSTLERYPNFVIAGAPKCGTSSLYFWLAPHPEVCASSVKETFFLADEVSRFNKDLNFKKDGLKAYSRFFSACHRQKIIFEATAPYIYYNTPIEVLPKLDPIPKIGFVLRDPAKRIYSKYSYNRYKLKYDTGSFDRYVSREGEGFAGIHVEEGMYARFIAKYIQTFGMENIFVITLEELLRDKVQGMKKLATWLDIDPEFYDQFNFSKRNETFGVRSSFLHRLGLKLQPLVPYGIQEALIPVYQKLNGTAIPSISSVEKDLVDQLSEFYIPFNRELQLLFPDLDLSGWLHSEKFSRVLGDIK